MNFKLKPFLTFDHLGREDIQKSFEAFSENVKKALQKDEFLNKNLDENLSEINDYVFLRLHKYIFSSDDSFLKEEFEYQQKLNRM